MKAMLMTAAGAPDVLDLAEVPTPSVRTPHELLVRVHAAGVNPLDAKIRERNFMFPGHLPAILGCDGAGVVAALGNAVQRFRVGDEVYFFNGGLGREPGTYAEYTLVDEAHAAAKPKSLTMIEAAAAPLVLITAWEALIERLAVQQGEAVLVHAGAGGVGHVAVQLGRLRGARVAATVHGADKAALAKRLGAEVTFDHVEEDFVAAAQRWTDGAGADAVLDTVGGPTFAKCFGAARPYGRVATLLSTACELSDVNKARLRNLTVAFVQMSAPAYLGIAAQRRRQTGILEAGGRLFDHGELRMVVSEAFALADAADAHRAIEAGHTTGKIVLRIA